MDSPDSIKNNDWGSVTIHPIRPISSSDLKGKKIEPSKSADQLAPSDFTLPKAKEPKKVRSRPAGLPSSLAGMSEYELKKIYKSYKDGRFYHALSTAFAGMDATLIDSMLTSSLIRTIQESGVSKREAKTIAIDIFRRSPDLEELQNPVLVHQIPQSFRSSQSSNPSSQSQSHFSCDSGCSEGGSLGSDLG